MKIVKLDIDENSVLAGIDAVALVEQPAIEEDFMFFSKTEDFAETYNDYPKGAEEAARIAIKRNKELGNKCGTQVGKVRAQQLAQRKPISLDTVRRMRAFLIRQKGNYDLAIERKDYNACGYISYMLWGGPEALPWAEKILRKAEGDEEFNLDDACQAGYEAIGLKTKNGRKVPNCVPIKMSVEDIIKEELIKQEMSGLSNESFSQLDEKQILVGPLMTPNKLIKRRDIDNEEYFVYFTEDTIKKLAYKAMRDKIIDRVNLEHSMDDRVDAYMVETWLVEDEKTDKSRNYGYTPKKGQWFGMYKVDDLKVWDDYIKSGLVKGFSVEGLFEEMMLSKVK
jgi:hypothetical protein